MHEEEYDGDGGGGGGNLDGFHGGRGRDNSDGRSYYVDIRRQVMDAEKVAVIKSMDYLQDIIKRMTSNSFKLKAWFLVMFSAIFTYFAKSESPTVGDTIWTLPIFMFALLDAYYLKQERIFRDIYNDFKDKYNGSDVARQLFDLTPTKTQLTKFSLANCVFSISVGWFYFPLLVAFQSLIIFYTTTGKALLLMLVSPALLAVLSLSLRKKTQHATGKDN